MTISILFVAVALAGLVALALLWLTSVLLNRFPRGAADTTKSSVSFLFHDDILTDLDQKITLLPGNKNQEIRTWADLSAWLGVRFGPLPESLSEVENGETRTLPAVNKTDKAMLTLYSLRGAERVSLHDPERSDPIVQHRLRHLDGSLAQFISVLEKAPCAVHMYDPSGETVWQNEEFARFTDGEKSMVLAATKALPENTRVCLPGDRNGQDRYFEIKQSQRGETTVLYLTDVTQIAQAETVRRDFIQTLTKTFANLTTGLAVFDRHRQLALFNPALLNLTHLPAPFLSSQPPLAQFFDKLRDNKVLPEPKNYGTWRSQVDGMISTACDGLYLEDWSLPNGMTYRVTGRPHPNGAVAFLFEDISDEVTLTRRFRSQIDLRQAALDKCSQAIAIIGPNDVVLLCNKPCSKLLDIDPDASFAEMSASDLLTICNEKLPDKIFWERAGKAVNERKSIQAVVDGANGRQHRCSISLLPGNSSMVSIIDIGQVQKTDDTRLRMFS